jgi:hypothetical protein
MASSPKSTIPTSANSPPKISAYDSPDYPSGHDAVAGRRGHFTPIQKNMSKHYSGDPRWITAKFNSVCSNAACGKPIAKGAQLFYYPNPHVFSFSVASLLLCHYEETSFF